MTSHNSYFVAVATIIPVLFLALTVESKSALDGVVRLTTKLMTPYVERESAFLSDVERAQTMRDLLAIATSMKLKTLFSDLVRALAFVAVLVGSTWVIVESVTGELTALAAIYRGSASVTQYSNVHTSIVLLVTLTGLVVFVRILQLWLKFGAAVGSRRYLKAIAKAIRIATRKE